jgi:flagellar transcriptional activator FlhD
MPGSTETLDSIREINLSYLLLAQRLLNEDRDVARFRLGLSEEVADLLGSLSLAQTVKLASTANLLCAFRMSDQALLSSLSDRVPRGALTATHAAILLASQAKEPALMS